MSTVMLISVIASSITTYGQALNNAYLAPEYWNDKASVHSINFNFNRGEVKGVAQYDINKIDNAIYFKTTFASDFDIDALKLHFDFYNDYNEYHFAINQYGICDFEGNENIAFEIIKSFEYSQIVGIKILDGSLVNDVKFTINYQDRNYIVAKSIVIDATPIEEETFEDTTIAPTKSSTSITSTTTKTSNTPSLTTVNETTLSTKFIPSSHHPATQQTTIKGTTSIIYHTQTVSTSTKALTQKVSETITINNQPLTESKKEINIRMKAKILGISLIILSLVLLLIYLIRRNIKPLDKD